MNKTAVNNTDIGTIYVADNALSLENRLAVDAWIIVDNDEVIRVRQYYDELPKGVTHQEIAEMAIDPIMDLLTEP